MKTGTTLGGAGRRFGPVATTVLAVALLSGCAATDRIRTGSVRSVPSVEAVEQMSAPQLDRVAGSLGQAYIRNPRDKTISLRYASVLQMVGKPDQALAVMRKAAIAHPRDRDVLAAYGKALAGVGQFEAALDAVR